MKHKTKNPRENSAKPKQIYYSQLPAEELDKLAAPFEKESVRTKPLTPAMRVQERRARRKRGRPVVGEGSEKVLISVERSLLRETDAYAKRHKKNRSQVIVQGLRSILFPDQPRKAS